MLKDIGIELSKPVTIHCDTKSTISMSKNPMLHSKTKHISIKYPILREKSLFLGADLFWERKAYFWAQTYFGKENNIFGFLTTIDQDQDP